MQERDDVCLTSVQTDRWGLFWHDRPFQFKFYITELNVELLAFQREAYSREYFLRVQWEQ